MVAVAVFSIVYMVSKSPLGRVLVAGFHRGGGFQPRDKKAARGRTGLIGFGTSFPQSRGAVWPNYFWRIGPVPKTTDTAIFLLTVRLLQDQYSHVLLKPFNKEGP
jgi:hypothetical protein